MRKWTMAETAHLVRLVEHRKLPWVVIAMKLGRSIDSTKSKYVALCTFSGVGAGDPEEYRPSPEARRDAIERLTEPRSLTAWLMHDPAPSRSALGRKMVENGHGHLGN